MRASSVFKKQYRPYIYAFLIFVSTLFAMLMLNYPDLNTYRIKGDDFAVIQHSSRFFEPSPVEWFTEGYSQYFINYPELDSTSTKFIRPTINATIFSDSLLASSPDSVVMLATNYVGHALVTVLVFLFGYQIVGLSHRLSILSALLFSVTLASSSLFRSVAFRGDMVATFFCLSALLVLHNSLPNKLSRVRFLLILVLSSLAVFAKEATFITPFLLGFYLVYCKASNIPDTSHPISKNVMTAVVQSLPLIIVLTLPLGLYGLLYLASPIDSGVYAVDDFAGTIFGIPISTLNPLRYFGTTFLIIETQELKLFVSQGFSLALIHMFLAGVINAIIWLGILYIAIRNGIRSKLAVLIGLLLISAALPIVLKADPRFMYLNQVFAIPLMVYTFSEIWRITRTKKRSIITVAFVLICPIAILTSPLYFVYTTFNAQPARVASNALLATEQAEFAKHFMNPDIKRLYLLNEIIQNGGFAKLRFYQAYYDRQDVQIRLINTLQGITSTDTDTGVVFSAQDDRLYITSTIGDNQQFFEYLTPEEAEQLGQMDLIEYGEMLEFSENAWGKSEFIQKNLTVIIPHSDVEDYVILGYDPASVQLHIYTPRSKNWESIP